MKINDAFRAPKNLLKREDFVILQVFLEDRLYIRRAKFTF